jgi:DNA modification methylase/ParB-like chromosome segregation protein Spo0J
MMDFKISDIKVGKRFRQDMGDIGELAESMKDHLLQPIGVTPKRELVFGERRLLAAKSLGWKTIPARIVDAPSILEGMLTENTMRKDFTVSERVAIYRAIMSEIGSRQGQRTDLELREQIPEVAGRTDDFAAKRAGLGNRKTAQQAEKVVEGGVPSLVEAMDKGDVSISAAAEVACLPRKEQREMLKNGCDQAKLIAREVRKQAHQSRFRLQQLTQQKVLAQSPRQRNWKITADQAVTKGQFLIVDPPYGITDEVWEPINLEKFTRDWASRWSTCGADFIAVFFSQEHMWEGRKWLDESLRGYQFQQTLIWHAPNNLAPKSRECFKQTWEPIFLYRRIGSDRLIHGHGSEWTGELHDLDCHIASVPQSNYGGDDYKQHPTQKPVSVMKWLINALTEPGETVVSLFSGVSPCGIAALQLGRQYHGIEINKDYRRIAEERLAAFGGPVRPKPSTKTIRPNTVVQGDCMALIPSLPNRSINLVLTSPAYAEQRKGYYRSIPERFYPEFTLRWMTALETKLADDGSVLIVLDPHVEKGVMADYVLRTTMLLWEHGWKQLKSLMWEKMNRLPLGHTGWPRHCYEEILWFSKTTKPFCDPWAAGTPSDHIGVNNYAHSLWTRGKEPRSGIARTTDVIVAPVSGNAKGIDHPAQFPLALVVPLIKTFCPPGGTVLDPFAGSGTTMVGAAGLERNWYGFDINAEYCELARQRLDKKRAG